MSSRSGAKGGVLTTSESIIESIPSKDGRPGVSYRYSGDEYILIEFGDMTTDFFYNLRAMGMGEQAKKIPGVIETVPAMRSLLVHFDSLKIEMAELLAKLKEIEEGIKSVSDLVIPSRLLRLPVAYRDKYTTEFIARYARLIRPDAPNIVDGHNIGYVAKYNGLSIEEMISLIESNQYWVAMLGFWPGLAFLTPLDPRAYLTAPKYNPSRPWTPEGAFGIGGPIVAVYPIESPGGYQLLGRSVPIYDLKQRNPIFRKNPVLFQPADRVQWETVGEDELEAIRKEVFDGTYRYRVYPYESFSVKKYVEFLEDTKEEAQAFAKRAEEARKGVPST
jgi:KipI family sensor histidine kinase inhibitor